MRSMKAASAKTVSDLSYDLITSGYSTTGAANIVLNYAKAMTGSTLGYVSVIDPATGNNICHTLTGMIGDSCRIPPGMSGVVFPVDESGHYPTLWGHALNTREPFYTNAPAEHPASSGLPSDHMPIKRFLSVPVLMDTRLLGQVSLANAPRPYRDEDLDTVCRVATVFAHALHRLHLDGKGDAPVPSGASQGAAPGSVDGPSAADPRSVAPGKDASAIPPDVQDTISKNLKRLASPYIEQLMRTELSGTQRFFLERLQENLDGAASSLLSRTRLMNVSLTPQEFQVAILIRSGLQTKDIARQLDVSVNAVNFHRKNIRRKLAINNKNVNLQTYLASLEDW